MRVLVLLDSVGFSLVHGLAERSHPSRQDGISLSQLLIPMGSTIELLYLLRQGFDFAMKSTCPFFVLL